MAPMFRLSSSLGSDSANDPISSIQYLRRDREPQGFCNLQVDSELDLRVHLHGNLCWVRSFENLIHQARRLPARLVIVWTIAGKYTTLHPECCIEHCWKRPLRGRLHDETSNVQG